MGIFNFFKRKEMETITTDSQMRIDTKKTMFDEQIEKKQEQPISSDFIMKVEDVFTITGLGTVAVGRINKGRISLNDTIKIYETGMTTTIIRLEQFRKQLEYAQEGDDVGVLLSDISRKDIEKGYHLVK